MYAIICERASRNVDFFVTLYHYQATDPVHMTPESQLPLKAFFDVFDLRWWNILFFGLDGKSSDRINHLVDDVAV